jgi:hypothetical protein
MTKKHKDIVLCHVRVAELKALDMAQGGAHIDQATGLRSYGPLMRKMEANLDAKQAFLNGLFQGSRQDRRPHESLPLRKADGGIVSPMALAKARKKASEMEASLQHFREAPGDKNPKIKAIADLGEGADTRMALLPSELVKILNRARGKEIVNPHTGLPMFFLKGLVRNIVAPIAAVVAAPWTGGASLGVIAATAAGGRALGGLLTGEKPKEAMKGALNTGGGTGAGGTWGPVGAGLGTAGTSLATGDDAGSALKQGLTAGSLHGIVGHILNDNALVDAIPGASEMAKFTDAHGLFPQVGKYAASSLGAQTGTSALSHNLLPLAAISGLGYMGQKHEIDAKNKAMDHEYERQESIRKNSTWYKPLKKPKKRERNPDYHKNMTPERMERGIYDHPFKYKHGGLVKQHGEFIEGPGKGQDDKIKASIPEGSYIIDASTTSDLGDGSSKAGAQALREMEASVLKSSHISSQGLRSHPKVPVLLSDSEYRISPEVVTTIGGGSNGLGARRLKNMVRNIRAHKAQSNLNHIPPKARNPLQYLQGVC